MFCVEYSSHRPMCPYEDMPLLFECPSPLTFLDQIDVGEVTHNFRPRSTHMSSSRDVRLTKPKPTARRIQPVELVQHKMWFWLQYCRDGEQTSENFTSDDWRWLSEPENLWPSLVLSWPWPLTFWPQNVIASPLSQKCTKIVNSVTFSKRFMKCRVHKLKDGRTHTDGHSENIVPPPFTEDGEIKTWFRLGYCRDGEQTSVTSTDGNILTCRSQTKAKWRRSRR